LVSVIAVCVAASYCLSLHDALPIFVVGRVVDIDFDNQTFHAIATLEIESQYKFPADSAASILTSGLLGEQYIGISPGGEDKDLTDRKSTRLNSSHVSTSYAVFCLIK